MDVVDVVVDGTAVIFTGARIVLLTLLAHFGAWTVNSGTAICFAVPPAALFRQTNTPRPSPSHSFHLRLMLSSTADIPLIQSNLLFSSEY